MVREVFKTEINGAVENADADLADIITFTMVKLLANGIYLEEGA